MRVRSWIFAGLAAGSSMLPVWGCSKAPAPPEKPLSAYLDYTGRDDILAGGVQMIPVTTPAGTFRVWTKRIGNNPRIKLLLLHGGPGFTHEYLEAFDSYLPGAGIEYYYYDQLGSHYSDQPEAPELWDTARFVDEVEQVRQALGLDRDNFFLLGHSWGGLLALEYALAHQEHLKALIISNMMASVPAYNAYADSVFHSSMDPAVLAELKNLEAAQDYGNPRYMGLLIPHHYELHVLRIPHDQWPDPVQRAFAHMNPAIYIPMQGPSELGASGKLVRWDRSADLGKIAVPALTIGAAYDTMDPKHMEWMAGRMQKGHYLHCPKGSHLALYDDQEVYMRGVIDFILGVDAGRL
ncbi:MAG TPA: proline iminopeptidase-family hydrolase [Candidatus Krumholzibacteria bacterium]|nr:proline iminopeptidase-family hydrolase [Candidatus Krumholzibacteria bacterium]